MDELTKLTNVLIADELIEKETRYINSWGRQDYRIKQYEYPETGNVDGPVIILDPLAEPIQSIFGDDEAIAEDFLIQVDVWSRKSSSTDALAKQITKVFREHGYNYSDAGPKEYDEGIFRSVRRYTGRYYTEEFTDAE